jgi:hypothetical protein
MEKKSPLELRASSTTFDNSSGKYRPELISSSQRSFNSRAAATNRGSFFVCFFSFGSIFSSITEGNTAPNRNPPEAIADGLFSRD